MSDFEEIYIKYALSVKKYLISLGADYNLADDLTAETFYKALKNISSFDDSKNMFTWLCTIAKRTYFDYIKKKDNNALSIMDYEHLITDFSSLPEISLEKDEQRRIIYNKLIKLDYPYKDIIYFRIFADLSFKEIGDIFEKNENWARVTFYRGKIKLKELLENEI